MCKRGLEGPENHGDKPCEAFSINTNYYPAFWEKFLIGFKILDILKLAFRHRRQPSPRLNTPFHRCLLHEQLPPNVRACDHLIDRAYQKEG
jgi:hypothetical protein